MAGINVNQITSMLAKLQPDSALQQYAAMHKNDPYIMALASSESNRRKELRAAAQAAQGAQPQPKVVDAALAQMGAQPMPEEMGIGALPAQNMQGMADGGIAGYEGYDEGGMTYGQDPVMMMADGGVVRYQVGGDTMGGFTPSFAQQELSDQANELALNERARSKKLAELQQKADFLTEIGAPQATTARAQLEEFKASGAVRPLSVADTATTPASSPTAGGNLSGMDRRIQAGSMPNVPSITPPAKAAPKGTRNAAPRPGAGAGPAAAAVPKEDPFSMEFLKKAQREAGGDYGGAELRNRAVEMRSNLEQQGEDRLAARRREIESEGDIYKGREDRLAKREADIGKQKGENEGLALLNAGLAIMSTPGKLAEAIGKGAQVGTAQYASGLKDLRVAQQKLEDARDNIEELRLNRSDMNKRDIRALEKERDANINKGNELMFGVTKDLYGMDREDTRSLVKSFTEGQQKQAQIQSNERIAATSENRADARANAPTASMREAMLLGTGTTPEAKYLSGMKVMKELTGDKQGTQLLKLFLEENGRREKNMEKPLTLDQFRRTSAAFYAPPAAVDVSKPNRP